MEVLAKGLSPENLKLALRSHAAAHYREVGDEYECKHCGTKIQQATLVVSIHSAEFGDRCAGPGKVVRYPLPYCPKCEGLPTNTSTCVHVPFASVDSFAAEMVVM